MTRIASSITVALGTAAFIAPAALAQSTLNAEPVTLNLDGARAYQAELLSDASDHASLLAGDSPTTGYNNGKFAITDGGANTLNISGFMQFRYIADFRKDQPNNADFTPGFQMRRTRLIFSGTVWDKHLSYQIQTDFDRGTGVNTLLDAYAKYTWDNGFYARWGQYKMPFLHEELVSDPGQLAIERSLVNTVFTVNRSQGAGVGWTDNKQFRVMGDLNDGINALNTDYNSTKEADYAITGRGEWMFAGDDFKRFDDFTSWKGAPFAGLLGAAFHYQDGGNTGFTVDKSVFMATADCSVEGDGWNAYVEGIWRDTKPAAGASTDDYGVVAQGGIFVSDQVELFGRYDAIFPDVGDNFNVVSGGVNYYIAPHSHAFQLSAEVMYFLDPTTNSTIIPPGNTGNDFLVDPSGHQVVFCVQLQVIF